MDETTQTIQKWGARIHRGQVGHYIACEGLRKQHLYLGIPLVIVASFLTATTFADVASSTSLLTKASLGFSLVATVLASLQTFLRPGERSETHRGLAAKYGGLKREIEKFQAQEHSEEESARFLERLQLQWDIIASDSPVTPRSIRERIPRS